MASRRELLARIGRAAASRVFGAVQGAVSDLGKGTLERIASALEEGLPSAPPKPQPSPEASELISMPMSFAAFRISLQRRSLVLGVSSPLRAAQSSMES